MALRCGTMRVVKVFGVGLALALETFGNEVQDETGDEMDAFMREVAPLSPEIWHHEYPQVPFSTPLRYCRTTVHVQAEPEDYFVMREPQGVCVSFLSLAPLDSGDEGAQELRLEIQGATGIS